MLSQQVMNCLVILMQQEVLICLPEVMFCLQHVVIKSKMQNPKLGNLKEYYCLVISEDHNVLKVAALQSLEPQILLAYMASDYTRGIGILSLSTCVINALA